MFKDNKELCENLIQSDRLYMLLIVYPRKWKCNWNNINKIREYGYEVRAGEEDSFGWLTGILEFPDGRQVVYG